MTKTTLGLTISVAFFVGCTVAQIAPFKVPPARADAPVTRWEILCAHRDAVGVTDEGTHEVDLDTGWNRKLAEFGSQGWEPVQVLTTGPGHHNIEAVCFKRPQHAP